VTSPTWPARWTGSTDGVRKRGWEAALRDAGFSPGLCLEGDWSPRWVYETGLQLVPEDRIPQAIFAASDHTALGLIRAFAEDGVRVPDDVSIVGFDDIEGSDYFIPPLTTVRQDFTALALMSMEVLISAMEGREVDRIPIKPTLVVRNSSTRAASRKNAPETPQNKNAAGMPQLMAREPREVCRRTRN
jgi:DNA-binding LacI/PurR family transcriptional regulator